VTGIGASFRAEVRDLLRHPLFWLGALATAAAAWLFGRQEPVRNGYVVFSSAALAGARTAGFFVIALAAAAIAGERSSGVVRFVYPRPVSRAGVLLGKASAFAVAATALLALCLGASLLASAPLGFGDIVHESKGFHFVEEEAVPAELSAATLRGRMRDASLLLLPALLSVAGVGILVSSLVRSASGAVIVALAALLPLNFLPELAGLRDDSFLPFRAAEGYLRHLAEFGRGLSTASWPAYPWTAALGAFVGAAGLPIAAALLFRRVDLTD